MHVVCFMVEVSLLVFCVLWNVRVMCVWLYLLCLLFVSGVCLMYLCVCVSCCCVRVCYVCYRCYVCYVLCVLCVLCDALFVLYVLYVLCVVCRVFEVSCVCSVELMCVVL